MSPVIGTSRPMTISLAPAGLQAGATLTNKANKAIKPKCFLMLNPPSCQRMPETEMFRDNRRSGASTLAYFPVLESIPWMDGNRCNSRWITPLSIDERQCCLDKGCECGFDSMKLCHKPVDSATQTIKSERQTRGNNMAVKRQISNPGGGRYLHCSLSNWSELMR